MQNNFLIENVIFEYFHRKVDDVRMTFLNEEIHCFRIFYCLF